MSLPVNINMYAEQEKPKEKNKRLYREMYGSATQQKTGTAAGAAAQAAAQAVQVGVSETARRAEISNAWKASGKLPTEAAVPDPVAGTAGAAGTETAAAAPVTGVTLGDYQQLYDRQAAAMEQANKSAQKASDTYYDAAENAYRMSYEDTARQLENQRAEGRRAASADLERLSRYLTLKDAYGGVTGSGMAESDRVAMANAALNRMYAADAAASEGQARAQMQYGNQIGALNSERAAADAERAASLETGKADLWAGYAVRGMDDNRTMQAQSEQDAESMLADFFIGVAGEDGKMSASEYKEMQAQAQAMRGSLSPFYQARLDSLMTAYGSKVRSDEDEAWNAYLTKTDRGITPVTAAGSAAAGNTLKVTMSGKTYKLAVGDTVADEAVQRQAMSYADGTVFSVGGVLFVKSAGSIFTVRAGEKDYAKVYKNFR